MTLTVALDARDAASADTQRSALASVPGGFRIGDGGPADVAVLSGGGADWVGEVARAAHGGVRGILLVRPRPMDAARVREVSRAVAGRCVVAVDTPYATDPAWVAVAGEVAADAATAAIVDSVVSVPAGRDGDLAAALLDQIAVVRPLVGVVDRLCPAHGGDGRYVFVGVTPGPRVSLTGVTSAAGRTGLTLDVVAPARRWGVRFDGTAPARPTRITRYDRSGAYTRPLIWASGHRATWQRLHEALTGGGTVGYSLDQLADDLELVGRVSAAG
jgi:hypothetical protein